MNTREILEKEKDCIEEHAPFCTAQCPFRVDVRTMMEQIGRKDYDGALSVFQKSVYFPVIVSKTCTAPCMEKCKRREIEESIDIPGLENAAARYGANKREYKPHMKLNHKVAVIGGGIGGLTAALYLYEKGYPVTLFEKEDQLGGALRKSEAVTEEELEKELAFLRELDIEFKLGVEVGKDTSFEDVFGEYEAVFLGDIQDNKATGILLDEEGEILVDPLTLQSSLENVFAPRAHHLERTTNPVVFQMTEAKKAVVTMDRFLKNVSMKANREGEGKLETQLFTSIEGMEKKLPLLPADPLLGYDQEEAAVEAQRCILCRCMECVKECIYMESFEKYPRKYIREIFNNLSTRGIGLRSAKDLINSCNLCGLCGEICPNSLSMGEINRSARKIMVKTNSQPPAIHDFPVRDMHFSNGSKSALCCHEPGKNESRYVFFPGCQLAAGMPQYISPMYQYLRDNLEGGVGLMLGCCGAPAEWAGREEIFRETLEQFRIKWEELGRPMLITACPTCQMEFHENIPEMQMISAWEIYDEHGFPQEIPSREGRTLSIHDPCTSRHETGMQQSIRSLLEKSGYHIQELKFSGDKTKCCGYGGLVSFGNKELAGKIRRGRLSESEEDLVTYCAVCRDFFVQEQKPVLHILDVLYGEDTIETANRPGCNLSEKRKNRMELKKQLASEIWGEAHENPPEEYEQLELLISEDLKKVMENRLILEEDILQVIYQAEKTDCKTYNPVNGHFTACHKPGVYTYWVEYSKEDEIYMVHNAYCHRLQILD